MKTRPDRRLVGGGFAFGLEGFERGEIFFEGAADAAFISGEKGKFLGALEEGGGGGEGGIDFVVAGIDGIDLLAMADGEDALLDRGGALEPPHGLGGGDGVEVLGGSDGVVFGDDFVEEFLVDGQILGGKAVDLAVEAGAGGVEGGAALAGLGLGTCAPE